MSTHTDTTNRYGSEMVVCRMRVRVKNGLLHKLGLVQPPYFKLPGHVPQAEILYTGYA